MRKWSIAVISAATALFLLIQLVPNRVQNPPVTRGAVWSSPELEVLARNACYDCHSNEVRLPWYGQIAPIAWVINDHVLEGRAALNFSTMDRPGEEAHEASEALLEGEMPPDYYTFMHGEANLDEAQKQALAAELDRLFSRQARSDSTEDDD